MNWNVLKMNYIRNNKFKILTFRLEPESLATDLHNLKNISLDINGCVWLKLNASFENYMLLCGSTAATCHIYLLHKNFLMKKANLNQESL